MKRLLTPLMIALSLSACTVPSFSVGTPSIPIALPAAPAPLAKTVIDDKALETAWKSFDLALDGIDILIDRGYLKKGTPKALAVKSGILKVSGFLTAAESAVAAGSTTDYGVAMAEAKGAITELRAALKGE